MHDRLEVNVTNQHALFSIDKLNENVFSISPPTIFVDSFWKFAWPVEMQRRPSPNTTAWKRIKRVFFAFRAINYISLVVRTCYQFYEQVMTRMWAWVWSNETMTSETTRNETKNGLCIACVAEKHVRLIIHPSERGLVARILFSFALNSSKGVWMRMCQIRHRYWAPAEGIPPATGIPCTPWYLQVTHSCTPIYETHSNIYWSRIAAFNRASIKCV